MKTMEFASGSGPFEHTATSSNKANERLDYLLARQASDSSTFAKRQYQTALADYRLACSPNTIASQASGMNSRRSVTDYGPADSSEAAWLKAKARLDHLSVRKVQGLSSYVMREYQHALTEYRMVCSARKATQLNTPNDWPN